MVCVGRMVRHELEMAGIGLALQAMWAANVLDIQKTLHQVRTASLCYQLTIGCGLCKCLGLLLLRHPPQPAQLLSRSSPALRYTNTHQGSCGAIDAVAAQSSPLLSVCHRTCLVLCCWPRSLSQVCKRLLKEAGVSRQEGKRRAQALSELGRIYCEAQAPPELQQSQEQHMQQALKKLQDLYCGGAAAEDEEEAAAAAGSSAAGGAAATGQPAYSSGAAGSRQQQGGAYS